MGGPSHEIGRLDPLRHLAVVRIEIAMADITEGIVASGSFERSRVGRSLRGGEHRAHVGCDRHRATHHHERKHRHRHHQEPRHGGDVLIDGIDPGPVHKAHPASSRRIGLRSKAVHDEHVNEDVDRSPGGKVEEPGKIALERRDAAARKQQQRKDDRKQRVEHHRQHDVQHRNPD